ncbi:MAG: 6-phospho-beta-glucosidase [Sulfobacillus benefaciens]|uniref:6-phospho-beta-glucosidase n=1 Tax=Sulfobacillus benefaciens TaxID=453960 RepID=A0A2T2XCW9_9FIRM|nr:MAG: 6-phospho-beta-glucosidase [Sulfobacillus benefaciens]
MKQSTPIKIGVIGGGSVFTPELIDLLARSYQEMPIREVVLMDINRQRVEILRAFAERLIKRAGQDFVVRTSTDYLDAIKGADFILIQLRAGDQTGRISDEKIGLKYRIPFVETVSVCGLGTFLRSIAIYEEIADLIRRYAPQAHVMNFANPAGPLTEYLLRLGITNAIGVCNVPIILSQHLAGLYGIPDTAFFMQTRGLNHLTVTDAIYVEGNDIVTDVLNRVAPNQFPFPFTDHVLHAFPAIFNPYLQYYWQGEKIMQKLLTDPKTRGEEVLEIEHELLTLYDNPSLQEVPELLKQRGGFGYSRVVVRLMLSLYRNDDTIHYINIKNNHALEGIPDDTAVEIPVMVKHGRLLPIDTGPLPSYAFPLIRTMAEYYRLVLDGAEQRSMAAWRQAMILHPLFRDADVADKILRELLEQNQEFLPDDFPRNSH